MSGAVAALSVEWRDVADLPALRSAWHDLCGRSLEPNIFLDPDFALPALAYLHPRRFKMLAVFESNAAERRLLALLPVALPAQPFGIARVYLHKQAALGLPLLDRTQAAPALAKLLEALKSLPAAPRALVLSEIPRDGPTFRLLWDLLAKQGAPRVLGRYERAALWPAGGRALRRNKARKNASRLLRRLSERGALSYRICRGAAAVDAMTEFLALESAGWKGASKTALASTPDRAAFAKTMAEGLVRAGKLHIESLDLDGRAAAMGLVIEDAGAVYFWKTAYDETLAALSPGALFVRELTARLMSTGSFTKVDSCAAVDHPMIGHIWPERLTMLDLGVVLRRGGRFVLALESLRRGARLMAKRLLRRSPSGKAPLAKTWRASS